LKDRAIQTLQANGDIESRPAILGDGRLDDQVLLAIVIFVEFGIYQTNSPARRTYNAALEALSQQYQGTSANLCNGSCQTLQVQLEWMDSKQGWYQGVPSTMVSSFEAYMDDALKVQNGLNDGDGITAWEWGNALPGSPMSEYIDDGAGGDPDWKNQAEGAFIVHFGYFVVQTQLQNIDCGAVDCMGFSVREK
jgi:hypothetical protein